jgi:hypothetical protein
MKEARIHTKFGEICISFDTTDQLDQTLQSLEEQIEKIQHITDRVVPPPSRTTKPGYESTYRFAPNGNFELLCTPKFRNEVVALVLFAYHPDPVSLEDLERFTGISKVSSTVLTLPQNKKYFRKVDEKYTLTFAGLRLVNERFGGSLDQAIESELSNSKITSTEETE